jgi:hypothetical protein
LNVEVVNLSYYKLLESGEVIMDTASKKWMAPKDVSIVGFQGSISSFPWLHAQAWLIINLDALKQQQVTSEENTHGIFGHLNSGSSGVANIAFAFPQDNSISLKMEGSLHLAVWGHNMFSFLGWKRRADFHVQYDIYYILA